MNLFLELDTMGKEIVVIAEKDEKEALENIKLAYEKGADMLEIREHTILHSNLDTIVKACKIPAIFTIRSKSEGGIFDGNSEEKKRHLQFLIKSGVAYIDNEFNSYIDIDRGETREIISYHDLQETPGNLVFLYMQMKAKNSDVVKIVTTARCEDDANTIYHLYKLNESYRLPPNYKELIAFSMATKEQDELSVRLAKETRVHAFKHGFGAFVVLDETKRVVPGQLTLDELRNLVNQKK